MSVLTDGLSRPPDERYASGVELASAVVLPNDNGRTIRILCGLVWWPRLEADGDGGNAELVRSRQSLA
jgi:hypothetical protein